MDESVALSVARSSYGPDELSTLDPELIQLKIDSISTHINVLQSRVAIMKAKILNGNKSHTSNLTLDKTNVGSGCKKKLNELWDAIMKLEMRTAGLKNILLDDVVRSVLSTNKNLLDFETSNPETAEFARDILDGGVKVCVASEELKKLCKEQNQEEIKFLDQRHEAIDMIDSIFDIKGQKEKPEKLNKNRILKIKTGRAIINCLLNRWDIDFTERPDLQEIKEKWRTNPSF